MITDHRLDKQTVLERHARDGERLRGDDAGRAGRDPDQRLDERGHEGRHHRPEGRTDDDRHGQVDDVAAQQELLEPVHQGPLR